MVLYRINGRGCHEGQPGLGWSRLVGIGFGVWNASSIPGIAGFLVTLALPGRLFQSNSGWFWVRLLAGPDRRYLTAYVLECQDHGNLLFRPSPTIFLCSRVWSLAVWTLYYRIDWKNARELVHCIISSLTCCQGQRGISAYWWYWWALLMLQRKIAMVEVQLQIWWL